MILDVKRDRKIGRFFTVVDAVTGGKLPEKGIFYADDVECVYRFVLYDERGFPLAAPSGKEFATGERRAPIRVIVRPDLPARMAAAAQKRLEATTVPDIPLCPDQSALQAEAVRRHFQVREM